MIQIENSSAHKLPFKKLELKKWIRLCLERYGFKEGDLSFVLASDGEVLKANVEFLAHDFYTDIITFDYSDGDVVSADILISYDRVVDNANSFKCSVNDELLRVMCHGLLHCMGYGDKTDQEKSVMRKEEQSCVELFHVKHF